MEHMLSKQHTNMRKVQLWQK